jgi:hypothetical protein
MRPEKFGVRERAMNTVVTVLAFLSLSANQSAVDASRVVRSELSAMPKQVDALHQAMQQHNDLLRDIAAARVHQCLVGAKDEKNPSLAGQMCVASFYLHNADFRAGFDMMLQTVDAASANQTREMLAQLMAILEKNGM